MFNDGANVIQVPIDGQLIDMVLSGSNAENLSTGELHDIPVVTRGGLVLRLHQLAQIDAVNALAQLRRLGGRNHPATIKAELYARAGRGSGNHRR